MKHTFKYFAVLVAASMAFVSCNKENLSDNSISRTFKVSFGETKSTIDGLTPKFAAGDMIKFSNGNETEDCEVSVSGGIASVTTTLAGTLRAVYPANAADLDGDEIVGYLVPTVQDGTFASANIAMVSNINGSDKNLTFTNMTAVFKITPGAGRGTKYVEVITAGPEIANSVPTGSEYTSLHKIHVATTSADAVYVSILIPSGLTLRDLSFADGSNIKTVNDRQKSIEANYFYTINARGWDEPYVEIAGRKWATRNVGAANPTDAGDYFMWGAAELAYTSLTDATFTFTTDKPSSYDNTTWNAAKGFSWYNAQYTNGICPDNGKGTVFTKYVPADVAQSYGKDGISDDKTVLDLTDDAANVNWGGSWHTPTLEESMELVGGNFDKGWDSTNKGFTFGVSPNQIFLPAAGTGNGPDLKAKGVGGYYWLSSIKKDKPCNISSLLFTELTGAFNGEEHRFYGQTVRPVSE